MKTCKPTTLKEMKIDLKKVIDALNSGVECPHNIISDLQFEQMKLEVDIKKLEEKSI